jgi:hypothetical protein
MQESKITNNTDVSSLILSSVSWGALEKRLFVFLGFFLMVFGFSQIWTGDKFIKIAGSNLRNLLFFNFIVNRWWLINWEESQCVSSYLNEVNNLPITINFYGYYLSVGCKNDGMGPPLYVESGRCFLLVLMDIVFLIGFYDTYIGSERNFSIVLCSPENSSS